MKYWKMPKELAEKTEKYFLLQKQINQEANEKFTAFFKEYFNVEIEFYGIEQSNRCQIAVKFDTKWKLDTNELFKKHFRFKEAKDWTYVWLIPYAKMSLQIARDFKKLHRELGIDRIEIMKFAEIFNAIPIHFSLSFDSVNNERVITKFMGIDSEEIGLIECKI